MTARRLALLAAMALTQAARADQDATVDVAATLAPAARQDQADFPFRRAELTLDARGAGPAGVFSAVALQETRGGPTFRYDVTLAPGTRRTLSVLLPATSQEQAYRVLLRTDDGRQVRPRQADAPIRWDESVVTEWEFLDPQAYKDYLEDLPLWPEALRRNVLLALVLTALAGAAVMLLRKPALRAVAVVLIAAGATAAVWMVLRGQEIFTEQRVTTDDGTLLIVRCRRSGTWEHKGDDLVPLYFNAWHMRQDRMEVHAGQAVRVPMNAREEASRVRLFRLRE